MLQRRRIDWSELPVPVPGPQAPPIWRDQAPAPPDTVALLQTLSDLFAQREPDAILRRTVELALDPIGLIRAGVYLYDEPLDLMLGSWGTSLERTVIDEHQTMFRFGPDGRRVFERALAGEACWMVADGCPIISNDPRTTVVVGQGWVVCTPIRSAGALIGMLYNDAGLTGEAVDPAKQARAAVLCSVVGLLLEGERRARGADSVTALAAGHHPAVAEAVRMLARDPSLTGTQIAAALDVSPSRFARVFKTEVGESLVDYRNRLRLERFAALVEAGASNLLDGALDAGFGSYAQFHRVFQAVHGTTPRQYLAARGGRRREPGATFAKTPPSRR